MTSLRTHNDSIRYAVETANARIGRDTLLVSEAWKLATVDLAHDDAPIASEALRFAICCRDKLAWPWPFSVLDI